MHLLCTSRPVVCRSTPTFTTQLAPLWHLHLIRQKSRQSQPALRKLKLINCRALQRPMYQIWYSLVLFIVVELLSEITWTPYKLAHPTTTDPSGSALFRPSHPAVPCKYISFVTCRSHDLFIQPACPGQNIIFLISESNCSCSCITS